MTMTPILVLSKVGEPYVVYTNASRDIYKGVLMHNDKVIAYTSQQLHPYEKNYVMHGLVLGAIIHALKKELNLRQRQYIEFTTYYDFQMRYHLGKANVVVDALSKKTQISTAIPSAWLMTTQFTEWHPWPMDTGIIYHALVEDEILDQIFEAQKKDGQYDELVKK
ncbi:unnamed protein product [Victoria cruziana]